MRKKISLILAIILLISLSSCEKKRILSMGEIPSELKMFVETHFSDTKIINAKLETEGTKKYYELLLEENIELTFNRKKEVINMESKTALPNSALPEAVKNYISSNYPDNVIIEWELERNNQNVKLDNDLELVFKKDGTFLRID